MKSTCCTQWQPSAYLSGWPNIFLIDIYRNSVRMQSMISLKHIALSTAILLGGALVTPAAEVEVWAPGVSEKEGWYDYHKTGDNDGWDADTAMCWAASASNVISWWQNLNAASITSTVPQNEKIFDIFKGVYTNGGGKAEYAYRWWVTSDGWNPPDGDGWAHVDKEMPDKYKAYANGGFLSEVYDATLYPITIRASVPDSYDPYVYSENIVKALESGYALTLSVGNSSVAHAYTLWGATYKIIDNNKYELTGVWLTNSDDINNEPDIFYKKVVCTYTEKGGSVAFDENMGATLKDVSGLRSNPNLIPEPASASLALAALLGLLGRRRRK